MTDNDGFWRGTLWGGDLWEVLLLTDGRSWIRMTLLKALFSEGQTSQTINILKTLFRYFILSSSDLLRFSFWVWTGSHSKERSKESSVKRTYEARNATASTSTKRSDRATSYLHASSPSATRSPTSSPRRKTNSVWYTQWVRVGILWFQWVGVKCNVPRLVSKNSERWPKLKSEQWIVSCVCLCEFDSVIVLVCVVFSCKLC